MTSFMLLQRHGLERIRAERAPRQKEKIALAASRRANAVIKPPGRRQRQAKTKRPTLVPVAVGLVVVLAGIGVLEYRQQGHPPENHARSEAPRQSPISPSPVVGDIRKDPRTIGNPRRRDDEATTLAKAPAQTSIVVQRDPTLDAWFINSYLRCWNPPSTLPQGEKYAAQIRVVHNADGSLSTAPLLVNPPIDPEWRAYADSAVRAVTQCNPLQVPPGYLPHFEQWRKMTLHFSPESAL
jgi:hypothetical protein